MNEYWSLCNFWTRFGPPLAKLVKHSHSNIFAKSSKKMRDVLPTILPLGQWARVEFFRQFRTSWTECLDNYFILCGNQFETGWTKMNVLIYWSLTRAKESIQSNSFLHYTLTFSGCSTSLFKSHSGHTTHFLKHRRSVFIFEHIKSLQW